MKSLLFIFISMIPWFSVAYASEVLWVVEPKEVSLSKDNVKTIDIDGATTKLIVDELKGYSHSYVTASVRRALKTIEDSELACAGNKVLTAERSRISVSPELPQVVFPGLRMYVLKDKASLLQPYFNTEGKLNLAALLGSAKPFQIGITKGRSYGSALDDLIANSRYQQHFSYRAGQDMSAALNTMFLNRRFDMLIEYPNIFRHYFERSNNQVEYSSFPITDSPQAVLGHYMCSKTEKGREFVKALQQAIERASVKRSYLDAHLMWFDKALWPELINYYNQVYGTDFKLADVTM